MRCRFSEQFSKYMMVLGTQIHKHPWSGGIGKGKSRTKPKSVVFNSVELTLVVLTKFNE